MQYRDYKTLIIVILGFSVNKHMRVYLHYLFSSIVSFNKHNFNKTCLLEPGIEPFRDNSINYHLSGTYFVSIYKIFLCIDDIL